MPDSLRDDRDAIESAIDELVNDRRVLMSARDLIHGHNAGDLNEVLDIISNKLAALEAELDEADAAVAQEDPERGVWGRDGL